MGKGYSLDLRERALKYFEKHSGRETSEEFGISRKALYDWVALKKETGRLQERNRSGRKSKLQEIEKFHLFLAENAGKSSRELAELWPEKVNPTTLLRWLHRLGYTFKKNVLPSETGRKSAGVFSKD